MPVAKMPAFQFQGRRWVLGRDTLNTRNERKLYSKYKSVCLCVCGSEQEEGLCVTRVCIYVRYMSVTGMLSITPYLRNYQFMLWSLVGVFIEKSTGERGQSAFRGVMTFSMQEHHKSSLLSNEFP